VKANRNQKINRICRKLYSKYRKNVISLVTAVVWFRKINRVNAIIAKFLTILKLQPNRATLRSDLTQAVR